MADQAQIDDKSYIGFQTGLGLAVTPDKQLPDISFIPDAAGTIRAIYAAGEEFPGAVQHGVVNTDVAVNGDVIDFVGVGYALEGFFGTVAPTTVAVTGKKRVYTPTTTLPRFFTNDYGSSTRFQRAIDCFLTKLHFHGTQDSCVFDGAGIGQLLLDSVLSSLSLAGSPTLVAQKTPDVLNSDLMISDTLAGLDSATPLGRGFVFDLNVDGRFNPIHPMNSQLQGNYDGIVRKRPSAADGQIQIGADNDGWAWLTNAKSNLVKYVRYRVFGQEIGAGTGEVQTVTLNGTPSGGTWTLTFPMFAGKTLLAIPYDVTAAALQAMINQLIYRGAAAVTVTKLGFVYTINFPTYLGDVAALTADASSVTGAGAGTATIGTTTPGANPTNYLFQVDAAVAARAFPKRAQVNDLDVLTIDLWLMKTATLNGFQVTTLNETATY